VIWRDSEQLPEELIFRVDYLGGDMPTFALNFSRPGGEIIAQYYNFIRYGRDGYRGIQQACVDTARFLAGEIEDMGPFQVLYDGQGGLPAVSYTLKDPGGGLSLYDLSDRLRMRGWQIASYPLPADRADTIVQRVMIRYGVSHDMISVLAEDMRRALAQLAKRAPSAASEHHPGFHH